MAKRSRKITDLSGELRRDRLAALRNYSASLMSNTKWRALFRAVADSGVEIKQIIVKFVGIEEGKRLRWVSLNAALPFVDTLEFGPVPLVGIEWLEFQCAVSHRDVQRDTAAVRAAIQSLGKHYPIEDRPQGLRVIGHLP